MRGSRAGKLRPTSVVTLTEVYRRPASRDLAAFCASGGYEGFGRFDVHAISHVKKRLQLALTYLFSASI
jgi:hypothetical protein